MALKEKSVLVNYLGSKKILKIVSEEQTKDLELLSDEFKRAFLEDSSNLTVTFQKFDVDWDDYID